MDLFEKLLKDRGHLGSIHMWMIILHVSEIRGEIAPRMTFKGKEMLPGV